MSYIAAEFGKRVLPAAYARAGIIADVFGKDVVVTDRIEEATAKRWAALARSEGHHRGMPRNEKREAEVASECGLAKPSQHTVLAQIAKRPDTTAKEIIVATGLGRSTVMANLRDLYCLGFTTYTLDDETRDRKWRAVA